MSDKPKEVDLSLNSLPVELTPQQVEAFELAREMEEGSKRTPTFQLGGRIHCRWCLEYLDKISKIKAENAALREALKSVLPPLDGDYSGSLDAAYGSYEDGSEPRGHRISRESIVKAHALLEQKSA